MSKYEKDGKTPRSPLSQAIREVSLTRRGVIRLLSAGVVMSSGLLGFPELSLADDKPVNGGKLRAAVSNASATDTLDPAKGSNNGDYTRQFMFYSGLTELDKHMIPQPALAESLETTDGANWLLTLRPGVTFHDGKALSAQDVVYSLSRHKDPAVGSVAIKLAEPMQSITAVSPSQVKIVLAQPNFDLPSILATSAFLILQDGAKDFTKAVGTGPYICKEFSPGVRSVGVRNPNYWKPGLPHLDEVELLGVTDQAARVNALLSGDLHVVATIGARDVKRLGESSQFGILESKSGMYSNLIIRADRTPGSNPDFVLAMKYMQPREMLLKTVMQGYGDIANDVPVPPWHPFYNKDLPQRPYDLDKARFHLKKAGLAGMKAEIITTPNIEGAVEGGQLLQQIGKSVGMDLQVRRVPYDGYWSSHWMKDPIGYGSINPRPTLDMLFSQFYRSDAPWNESGWKNDQFDQLVTVARSERDVAKRKQMYGDMQQLIYDHNSTLIPLFISSMDGYSKKVKGIEPWPSGLLMGYRFHEFAWLSA
ncbi:MULTISPECIES: ABC transporter substrate-binding protein [Dickeya]|uniref:ABC transporter substrate-binding protein n=1 Tax=Dickeya TaxID=204037 RepID=UPI00039BA5A0|nr:MULTISPECIES: ABC transporter substrate-binding protein [Dickeya]WKV51587.1 ABC transporter substrate-binding protein [Dickeya fangzhongdai]